jgi:hypothetical protein
LDDATAGSRRPPRRKRHRPEYSGRIEKVSPRASASGQSKAQEQRPGLGHSKYRRRPV